jgi:hypothetical protein
MGWNNQLVALIVVSASGGYTGLFVYSPTPGIDNLALSVSDLNGEDPYGNNVYPGLVSYNEAGNGVSQILAGSVGVGTLSQLAVGLGLGGFSDIAAVAGRLVIWSGQAQNADAQAFIKLFSAACTASDRTIAAGATEIDVIAQNVYLNGQLNLLAGNGPFVFQESWHNVTPPAGYTGNNRYKLLPWNCVLIDVQLSGTSTGGNITCMTLPAGYQPAGNLSEPLAITTTAAALPTTLRMTIQSNGAVVTSALPNATTSISGTWMVPLN